MKTRFVCISDTHNKHRKIVLPHGDVLLHCGDITNEGTAAEFRDFNDWIESSPFRKAIIIGGNHDSGLFSRPHEAKIHMPNCQYLCDQEVVIDGIRIYGIPWYQGPWSFGLSGAEVKEKMAQVPDGVDILVTHFPPFSILDQDFRDQSRGSVELFDALERIQPKVVCFGHEHHSYGKQFIKDFNTWALNASICDDFNEPTRSPLIFDFHHKTKKVDFIQ